MKEYTVEIEGVRLHLCAADTLFSPDGLDEGTRQMLRAVEWFPGAAVLDLGCGYGPIGITLARDYPKAQFVLSDVNRRAVALCEENIAKNKIANAKALFSDGCAELDGTFDQIVSNPPIRIGKSALQNMWRDCH